MKGKVPVSVSRISDWTAPIQYPDGASIDAICRSASQAGRAPWFPFAAFDSLLNASDTALRSPGTAHPSERIRARDIVKALARVLAYMLVGSDSLQGSFCYAPGCQVTGVINVFSPFRLAWLPLKSVNAFSSYRGKRDFLRPPTWKTEVHNDRHASCGIYELKVDKCAEWRLSEPRFDLDRFREMLPKRSSLAGWSNMSI